MKYTFVQFIAATESKDFDKIEDLDWASNVIAGFPEYAKHAVHDGDCTKQSTPCMLCMYERFLSEYREYFFDETKYREEHIR